jgi:dimethylargininase
MFNYPFDFHFTSAIVCRVANSLKDAALCQREIKEVMNIDKARRQHQDYIAILRKLGLDVIELQSDETLPEGVFVEDTAVICDGIALICRPGLPGRLKEVDIIRTILRREGLSIVDIKDPLATIDGGDVLFTGREFFVGLSRTTNMAGAKAVASAFPEYPVTLLRV